LFVLACALFVVPARGSVEDGGGAAPNALPAYRGDVHGRERPRRLDLDGMTLAVAAGVTGDAPSEVAGFYAEALGDARHGCGVRFGDDERGGVAAIDYGAPQSENDVAARMGALAATGDLAALGQLQAVMYERRADGGTRYLGLWGPLSLDRLLPPDGGDVAGGDLDGVPRPVRGERVLVAGERGQAARGVAYRVRDASAAGVRGAFVDELRARGWRSDEEFERFARGRGRAGERLWRRGRELYVDVTRQGDDVSVVVIEMERRG
jgi:hypothetical protein